MNKHFKNKCVELFPQYLKLKSEYIDLKEQFRQVKSRQQENGIIIIGRNNNVTIDKRQVNIIIPFSSEI